jgi:chromate transporter
MHTDEKLAAPKTPSMREAFWYWLKLGLISFGGPAGQIAIMHQDLVENKRWISDKRFLHALNYCMVLPGPEAQQLATYIGWLMHRTAGGLVAGGLFVLPSLVILIVLSYIYMRFGHLPAIAGALYGVKPAVVAIVLFAAYRIGSRVLKNSALWVVAATSFVAVAFFQTPFPVVVLIAALLGALIHHLQPHLFTSHEAHRSSSKQFGRAVIDDETPVPTHARFSLKQLLSYLLVGIGIWLVIMCILVWSVGWDATFTQMSWFFTKAALLTFGGAYAVLPYVYQGAVSHFAWLTPTQMMDGLALGETTPGPLIMVVTFVGFVGGWTHSPLADPLASGVIAACLVTFFTFLPSFVFIFVGAPLIESSKNNLKLTAPLKAITAAVVGVIVSLAVFFAQHVFWPNGLQGNIDAISVLANVGAVCVLFRYKPNIMKLVLTYAVLGLLYSVIG